MPILDKRKGDDILALVPASKRTKTEVVFSSREKAIVQSVSITSSRIAFIRAREFLIENPRIIYISICVYLKMYTYLYEKINLARRAHRERPP